MKLTLPVGVVPVRVPLKSAVNVNFEPRALRAEDTLSVSVGVACPTVTDTAFDVVAAKSVLPGYTAVTRTEGQP